jgi:hypothetical protein
MLGFIRKHGFRKGGETAIFGRALRRGEVHRAADGVRAPWSDGLASRFHEPPVDHDRETSLPERHPGIDWSKRSCHSAIPARAPSRENHAC